MMPPTRLAVMRDGRRLAYVERGDPDGSPVLHHHGMPGSRLQHEADDALYRSQGVRLITPDRPGYGLSDARPDARLTDWPEDVADLMDHLGVHRFGVTALSGGGIYALACAAGLPDQVSDVAVTGCPAPMQIEGAFRGMRFMTRAGVYLGAHALWMIKAGAWAVGRFAENHPRFVYERFNQDVPPADRRWMSTPSFEGGAIEDLREALRNGPRGYVKDIELLATPWGFDPQAIRVPVQLWHGDADAVIPLAHSRHLASRIPGAVLHVCPGEGHLLLWGHLEEVLLEVTATLRRERREYKEVAFA